MKQKFVIRTTTNKYAACEFISELDVDEDHPWSIEVMPYELKRSLLQNSYLWGWLYRYIADKLEEAGIVIPLEDGREYPYNADMLHEIFKDKFLCYDEITVMVKHSFIPFKKVPVTRKLCYSTTQLLMKPKPGDEQRGFKFYVDSIKQFAYQVWGLQVPPTFNNDFRSLERDLAAGKYR